MISYFTLKFKRVRFLPSEIVIIWHDFSVFVIKKNFTHIENFDTKLQHFENFARHLHVERFDHSST